MLPRGIIRALSCLRSNSMIPTVFNGSRSSATPLNQQISLKAAIQSNRITCSFRNYSSNDGDSAFAQAMRQQKKQSEKQGASAAEDEKDEGGDENKQEIPKKKSAFNRFGGPFTLFFFSTYLALGWLGESPDIEGEDWFTAHNRRSKEVIIESYEYFMNPPKKALLPPLPVELARDYTICLELPDALVHMDWDVSLGWRIALRPGLKQLLFTLHQYYEVVVFTNMPSHLASPLIDAIDNFGLIFFRLFREHHRLDKDTHLKDLSFLNRDLSKVVVIGTDPASLSTHPENGILMKEWKGEKGDLELYKYVAFLQELFLFAQQKRITDLRPLLTSIKSYDEYDIPKAWEMHKEHLRLKTKENQEALSEKSVSGDKGPSSMVSWLVSSLTGGGLAKGINRNTFSDIDKIELLATEQRQQMDKQLEKHLKDVSKHQEEQDIMVQKQIDEIKNSDLKLIDYLMGNGPQPGQPIEPAK